MRRRPISIVGGFTLLELVVVVFVLAVLMAMLLPPPPGRTRAQQINCLNNLKHINLGLQQWSFEHDEKYPMGVSVTNGGAREWLESGSVFQGFLVASNELNTPKILSCPADYDSKHVQATSFEPIGRGSAWWFPLTNDFSVSYFLAPDSTPRNPQSLLTGDSNLEISDNAASHGVLNLWTNVPVHWNTNRHPKRTGNIAFADGSVQKFTSKQLPELISHTGLATNRLVIP